MTMDDTTKAGVLASMAFRRVDAMRRRVLEDIVKASFDATGELPTADVVLAKFEVLWVEPTAEHVANMVAAKCEASIEYHNTELKNAATLLDQAAAHDARRGLDGVTVAAARDEDQVGRITTQRADAAALASFAPGDASKAPPALMAQRIVPQPVADFVESLMTTGV